jgi:hypothetical protein
VVDRREAELVAVELDAWGGVIDRQGRDGVQHSNDYIFI